MLLCKLTHHDRLGVNTIVGSFLSLIRIFFKNNVFNILHSI